MSQKEKEPEELEGYCVGCKKFVRLYRVSKDRYRCIDCSKEEGEYGTK